MTELTAAVSPELAVIAQGEGWAHCISFFEATDNK